MSAEERHKMMLYIPERNLLKHRAEMAVHDGNKKVPQHLQEAYKEFHPFWYIYYKLTGRFKK